jgi:hypothetical protein
VTRLIVFVAIVIAIALVSMRSSKRGGGGRLRPGPGTMGTIYDLLNEEKRNAIEIILEEKAEARDPERAAGNLPELEDPRREGES